LSIDTIDVVKVEEIDRAHSLESDIGPCGLPGMVAALFRLVFSAMVIGFKSTAETGESMGSTSILGVKGGDMSLL
jgi:hypothetical protein